MIRDRLVVGLKDVKLSEKLQMDPNLTLKRATDLARRSEIVKKQQDVIRQNPSTQEPTQGNVDAISRGKRQFKKPQTQKPTPQRNKKPQQSCQRCGKECHNRESCPARDAVCHKCLKKGHYQRFCKTKAKVQEIEIEDDQPLFLGEVSGDKTAWKASIVLNDRQMEFKLDSGADVCVIPEKDFDRLGQNSKPPILTKSSKTLYGPCRYKLSCKGKFKGSLRLNQKTHDGRRNLRGRRSRVATTKPCCMLCIRFDCSGSRTVKFI